MTAKACQAVADSGTVWAQALHTWAARRGPVGSQMAARGAVGGDERVASGWVGGRMAAMGGSCLGAEPCTDCAICAYLPLSLLPGRIHFGAWRAWRS